MPPTEGGGMEIIMKNEKKITVALLIVYLLVLSWIILFKLQFSFSALDHIREINLIPFGGSVIANGKVDFDEIINNFCDTFRECNINIDISLLRNCYANGVFKYYSDGAPLLTDYKKIGEYFKKK